MKKITILMSVLFIGVFLSFIFYGENNKIKPTSSSISGPSITKEKHRWFIERYADPATGELPPHINSRVLEYINSTFIPKDEKLLNEMLMSEDMWDVRGPYEIGGRTRSLGIDIRNENIIIAGGVSGGMWRSVDGGAYWAKTTRYDQLHSSTCLVQDTRPGKEDNWYYASGEYFGNSAAITGDGVFKSTDNGQSWDVLPVTSTNKPNNWDNPFDYCWNIVTDPTAPLDRDDLYVAAANYGILKSTDAGNTWTTTLGAGSGARQADIAVTSDGVFYATLSSNTSLTKGIYRSENGIDWTNITPPGFPNVYERVVIGIAPSDENQVYFVGNTPGFGKLTHNSRRDSLYHSLWHYTYLGGNGAGDNGRWEDRSMNLPKPDSTKGQMNSQWGYNLVIKVKPDNPDIVYLGAVALYRSDNGFRTPDFAWIGGTCPFEDCDYNFRYPNHHADNHAIVFSRHDYNRVYTGSDGGVHVTLDGEADVVEWISLNNGYYTTQFYSIAIEHSERNSIEIIGGMQDNGTMIAKSMNVMDRWTEPLRADGFCCQIPAGAEYYYASQNSSSQPAIKIFRVKQDENGNNLIQTRIDPIGGRDFIWNTPFILDPNDNNRMYLAGGKMVWRNNDLTSIPMVQSVDSTSIGWDSLSNTRIDFSSNLQTERITAIQVSTNPANVLYYGTSRGNIFRIDNADVGDPTPVNITPSGITMGYVSSFAIDPDNANDVIFSYSNYNILSVFRSTDGGESWVSISGNLEEMPNGTGAGPAVNWIEILKQGDTKIYFAGTSIGLFSTTFLNDNSTVWKKEGLNVIGNVVVDMIDARHSDSFVAIGTHATGMYSAFYEFDALFAGNVNLTYPANNARFVVDSVHFNWSEAANAGFYELQISKTSDFSEIYKTIHGIRTNTAVETLLPDGREEFYWRVRAISSNGAGDWSQAWKFTTIAEAPTLLSPENANLYVPLTTTLEWSQVEGISQYRIQFNSGFSIQNPMIDTIVTGNSLQISDLNLNTRYIWRVLSIEEGHQGQFSGLSYFMTREPTSVAENLTNLVNVVLAPNPVADYGNLKFQLNAEASISAEIFDSGGRLRATLINQQLYPGNYNYPLNFTNLPSGSYFVRFVQNQGSLKMNVQTIPINIVR
ncbi:MAG: T9SS type A sorting domain-containing protein [Candidatus Kapabacteria bacterium]|nr:T9SS type A sorting domain-containing protein [Candidatus Kapabacteria bacterium]